LERTDLAVVLCTVPDKETGRRLAWLLVEEKLAACVNIVDRVTSVYRWQGEIQEDEEYLLIIKTRWDRFDKLRDQIVEAHPYDVPEIVAIPVVGVHEPYGAWLSSSTSLEEDT
jgi:periplasmic divalent cation tolerance protein